MTSETREIAHNQHSHPGIGFYLWIGIILIGLTVLEVAAFYVEKSGMAAEGFTAWAIAVLSTAKFLSVVMFYMHLKFDSKLFTGVFVFPALLGTLVIVAMFLLEHKVDVFRPLHSPPVEQIQQTTQTAEA